MFHPHPTNQPTYEAHEVALGSGVTVVTKSETKTPKHGSTAYELFKTQLKSEREKIDPNNIVESTFSKECSQLWKGMTSAVRQPYIDLAKETKDPNAPRRPMTSYLFFSKEYRPIVKHKYQHLSAVEVSKLMGQVWRSLDQDQKAKYDAMNVKDWDRYEKELEEYKQPSKRRRVQEPSSSSTRDNFQEIGTADPLQMFQPINESQSAASGSGVTVVSKAGIKSPMATHGNASTAYGVFKAKLQSERQKAGNFVGAVFSKECSQLWKNMTRIERQPYINLVKETKDPNAPKKPRTPYAFFCKEFIPIIQAKNPQLTGLKATTEIGQMWKSLREDEKTKYYELNVSDLKRYEKELEDYNKSLSKSHCVQDPSSSSSKNSFQVIGTVGRLPDPEFQCQRTINDQVQNSIFNNYDGPTNIWNGTGAVDGIFQDISFNYGQ